MKFKNIFLTIVSIVLFMISLNLNGQVLYTKTDTFQLEQDSVILKVNDFRGNIQWQFSKDMQSWNDIELGYADSLFIQSIDSSGFYRAKVTDGYCEPVFSDSTYILRKIGDEEMTQILVDVDSVKKEVLFFSEESANTELNIVDTSGLYDVVEIVTTENLDSISPGYLLVDTTGLGRIVLVTNYTKEKGTNGSKFIEGIIVGMDYLVTDQTLSYSSPANRTKGWWNSPLKLNNKGAIKDVKIKSELDNINKTISKDLLTLDFSGTELWNYQEDHGHFKISIEEGYLKYNPAIDFYAIYKPIAIPVLGLGAAHIANPLSSALLPLAYLGKDYIVKGAIDELKLITYNDIDLKIKLKIDAAGEFTSEDYFDPVTIAQFSYGIPAGPVVITVKTELIARLKLEAKGELHIQPDYELQNNIVLGVNVKEVENKLEKNFIVDQSNEKSLEVEYEGNFNFNERLEIVPKVEVYVMGLAGLNAEMIPYQEFDFNASISDSHPLIYDYTFDIGVDGYASFDLSAFHYDPLTKKFGDEWEIFKKINLYHTPSELVFVDGNDQSANANSKIEDPIVTRVLDSRGNPIKNFPVFFDIKSGGGSLKENVVKSDLYGYARTEWTLGSEGDQKVIAKLTKADINVVVGEVEFSASINSGVSPSVSTLAASNKTETSAKLHGEVTSDGNSTILERGFYWSSTDEIPNENDEVEPVSGTVGAFNITLSDLEPNIVYYFRAFATNEKGSSEGDILQFILTQQALEPEVTITAVSATASTASVTGNVTSNGGAAVSERGICWNTTGNPSLENGENIQGGSGLGEFTVELTGLESGTLYYLKAYAMNTVGIAYSDQFDVNTVDLPAVSISSVTPSEAILGVETTFTVSGSGLVDGMAYYLADLEGIVEVAGGTATTRQFRGIPGSTIGTKYGVIKDIPDGTILKEFQVTFVEAITKPTVTTTSISNKTETTATAGGNVTSNGGATVTARGVCWNTSGNPTTSDDKTTDGSGVGMFASNLTGLTESTTYFVRAYATNSIDTDFGDQVSFTTESSGGEIVNGSFTDSRDGNTYKVVTIGDQIWMAENLAYDAGDGCWAYNNDESNVATYGRLYDWGTANAACPNGWHLPTDTEWTELENALTGADKASQLAGSANLWQSGSLKNSSQFGTSGFSGLPGGASDGKGVFFSIDEYGNWWSATEYSSNAEGRNLFYDSTVVTIYGGSKEFGVSVRCVKD